MSCARLPQVSAFLSAALGLVLAGAVSIPARGEPPAGRTGTLSAKVGLLLPGGKSGPAAGAVVWVPDANTKGSRGPAAGRPSLASRDKRFDPRVLVVPVGTTVDFPNVDKIFHNVFSLSETARFDLGLYRKGEARATTFTKPGLVRLYCNIHPQMAAFILVVEGGAYGQADDGGAVTLEGLAPGRHVVRAWHERGGDWTGSVEIPEAPGPPVVLQIVLDASTWKETPHKNKHGKDYPPPDDDDNRY